jgi:SAM-dependent methyltransferase
MESWRGYAVHIERVTAGERTYELLVPAKPENLLDEPRVEARFAEDEYMPYWAALWPGALLLADVVGRWPRPPTDQEPPTVLELGCGLGLVGIVAAERGYRVTVADYDEDALAFAIENAWRNGLPLPDARYVDWRQSYPLLHVDRILAADVLYEARNLQPVAEFIRRHLRPGGFALVSDANRSTANPFEQIARQHGLAVTVTPMEKTEAAGRPEPSGGAKAVPIRGRIYHLQHAADPVLWRRLAGRTDEGRPLYRGSRGRAYDEGG